MAGKCFIFAPISLRCCIAYLTACSDIWVWPFCAAGVNHWNKSIDIKIIKPFTFHYRWDFFFSWFNSTVFFFYFSPEWKRADNDNQLVAISGMLDSNTHTHEVCYEGWEEFIITTLCRNGMTTGWDGTQKSMKASRNCASRPNTSGFPTLCCITSEFLHPNQRLDFFYFVGLMKCYKTNQICEACGLTFQNYSKASIELQTHYFLYSNIFWLYNRHKRGWKNAQ